MAVADFPHWATDLLKQAEDLSSIPNCAVREHSWPRGIASRSPSYVLVYPSRLRS